MQVPDASTSDSSAIQPDLVEIVEALIFASDHPVSVDTIGTISQDVTGVAPPTPETIERAVDFLNETYERTGRVFRIRRWAGGFQMATVPRVEPFLRAYFSEDRSRKLSRTLLETLAIVAYRQPVSKPEVDSVRGVDSSYTLKKLLELDLLDIVGRSEAIGRPLLYGTTNKFLESFGLGSLDALPKLREIEDILNDPKIRRERLELALIPTGPIGPKDEEPSEGPGSFDDDEEDRSNHGKTIEASSPEEA